MTGRLSVYPVDGELESLSLHGLAVSPGLEPSKIINPISSRQPLGWPLYGAYSIGRPTYSIGVSLRG